MNSCRSASASASDQSVEEVMEFNGTTSFCCKSSFTNNKSEEEEEEEDEKDDEEKLEAMELLDEYWFFENLLQRRTRMFRSSSDPYPASSKNMDEIFFHATSQEVEEAPPPKIINKYYSSTTDIHHHHHHHHHHPIIINSTSKEADSVIRSNLLRTPSLPPSINKQPRARARIDLVLEKEFIPTKISKDSYLSSKSIEEIFLDTQNANKSTTTPTPPTNTNSSKEENSVDLVRHNYLLRAPSLPPSLGGGGGEEEYKKEFTHKSSSKLSRQASLCSSDVLPPAIRIIPKNLNQIHGIPRHRAARRELRAENVTKDREVIRRSLSFKKSSSSLNVNDLEVEEVQGFKDLGFVFDKDDVNKSLANIIPGLQDKKKPKDTDEEENKARRPYLSEAWLLQPPPPPPPPPPVPNWVDRKRSTVDMKAQLKYWARTVASNVRQEC